MVKKEWAWMYFNDEWNMNLKETKENDIPHSEIRRMESEGVRKKNSDGIPQTLSDDDIYEDGIDERPSVKESDNYNDDDYDY
jgi:hypothetical protein|tara:strand:+ start:308 stop:553 length:246 start_codon:yes stop_codon:yes gene_type:complete